MRTPPVEGKCSFVSFSCCFVTIIAVANKTADVPLIMRRTPAVLYRGAARPWKTGLDSNYAFMACSTATATATDAPTIGLLPMPIKPIISTCAGTEDDPAN
jgi:hypothetical protein